MTNLKRRARKTGERLGAKTKLGSLGREDMAVRASNGRYYVREIWADGRTVPAVALPLAKGAQVPPNHGITVRLGYDATGQRVILGLDSQASAVQGITPTRTNMADPQNWTIRKEQIVSLRCRPSQDPSRLLYAEVLPDNFVIGSTYYEWPGGDINLSGEVPSSGNHCYTVVCWRTSTNDLSVASSTPQSTGTPLTSVDVQEAIDAADNDAMPIKAFVLTGDMTALDGSLAGCKDIRTTFSTGTGSGGGTPGDTVEDETTYGLTPDAGVATEYSRTDHTHGSVDHDDHANLTNVTSDQHHPKSHGHTGGDGSGTVDHANLTNVTSDQHHPRSHDHSSAGDGTSLVPATLTVPVTAAPSQTTAGRIEYDSVNETFTVGHGSGRRVMGRIGTTSPLALGSASAGTAIEVARVDHVHPTTGLVLLSTLTTKGDLLVATGSGAVARQGVGANDTVLVADSAQTNGIKWEARAKTDLSNLASVAFNANLIPDTDNSRDLGSAAKKLANMFARYLTFDADAGVPSQPATNDMIMFGDPGHMMILEDWLAQSVVMQHGGVGLAQTLTNSASALAGVLAQINASYLDIAGIVHTWAIIIMVNSSALNRTCNITYNFGAYSKTRTSGSVNTGGSHYIALVNCWTLNDQSASAQRHLIHLLDFNNVANSTFAAPSNTVMLRDTSTEATNGGNTTVSITGTMSAAASGLSLVTMGGMDGPYSST